MRIKEGYIIRRLGDGFVVITVGPASRGFNGMIRLNAAGAFLWQSILDGADSKQKLIDAMMERYDDLGYDVASRDLDEFLNTVAFAMEEV